MEFRIYVLCIAILLSSSGICIAEGVATVHGVAYEWSTFYPLDNAIIEVNSTPTQSLVAKSGIYSFDLQNGSYLIKARYYQNDVLTHYVEENITVLEGGNYVLDLLLFPSYTNVGTVPDATGNNSIGNSQGNGPSWQITLVLLTMVLVSIILLYHMHSMGRVKQLHHKHKGSPSAYDTVPIPHAPIAGYPEPVSPVVLSGPDVPIQEPLVHENVPSEQVILPPEPVNSVQIASDLLDTQPEPIVTSSSELAPSSELVVVPLNSDDDMGCVTPVEAMAHEGETVSVPADLQEIIDILRSQGGRMTQKDLRKRLKYSEGKVSLMLIDLEQRGKIKKFKKGRGNILFLVDEE